MVQEKTTVVFAKKVSGDVVRSSMTSYDSTERSEARTAASSRVRLIPGMANIQPELVVQSER
ncbi:unannotated protein [freshwater metagenome]|uniref:Unannotated protein n=1 Tax=freshwater metagenome TaxID=449393 RepID=A0A6J6QN69_9ZZZZ